MDEIEKIKKKIKTAILYNRTTELSELYRKLAVIDPGNKNYEEVENSFLTSLHFSIPNKNKYKIKNIDEKLFKLHQKSPLFQKFIIQLDKSSTIFIFVTKSNDLILYHVKNQTNEILLQRSIQIHPVLIDGSNILSRDPLEDNSNSVEFVNRSWLNAVSEMGLDGILVQAQIESYSNFFSRNGNFLSYNLLNFAIQVDEKNISRYLNRIKKIESEILNSDIKSIFATACLRPIIKFLKIKYALFNELNFEELIEIKNILLDILSFNLSHEILGLFDQKFLHLIKVIDRKTVFNREIEETLEESLANDKFRNVSICHNYSVYAHRFYLESRLSKSELRILSILNFLFNIPDDDLDDDLGDYDDYDDIVYKLDIYDVDYIVLPLLPIPEFLAPYVKRPYFVIRDNHVVNLSIVKYGLSKIPHQFGNLEFLKELDISYNSISKFPDSFSKLHNLEILNISGNPLTDFSLLDEIKSLTRIVVSKSQVKMIKSADMKRKIEVID